MQITIFKQPDGTFGYCPTEALKNPSIARAMRYSDEPGFQTVRDAMNAIKLNRTIPRNVDVVVEEEVANA